MGVYRSEPETTKRISEGENEKMKFVTGQMQGWRKNMEDAAIHNLDIGDGNSLFAVFDGHGGAQVSQYVALIFLDVLREMKEYKDKQYAKALDKTFMKIDEMIDSEQGNKKLQQIRKRQDNGVIGEKKVGSATGCTANVVLITPEQYIIANAGDSRSALSRQGKLVVFSEDHKPENPIESARIAKAGGTISMGRVNGGLNLSRSFGDFDYKRNTGLQYDEQMITCKPDIRQVNRLSEDEFFLVGCDGIWERYVDNTQGLLDLVKSQLRNKKQHRRIIEDLLMLFLAKDTHEGIGCDNMTMILVVLK